MSANNYRDCPKCKKLTESRRIQDAILLEEKYGKVSVQEYANLLRNSATSGPKELGATLREDWSIGTAIDSTFFVEYRASCDQCGLVYDFKASEKVKL